MSTTEASPSDSAARLRASFHGTVTVPGDEAYEAKRKTWNGTVDRRPDIVATCTSTADVVAAVNFARESGITPAVRGGGHSLPGFSTCDGGLVIDLSGMRSIEVDPANRVARAGGGATWSDFDAATHPHGLATPGGLISSTGVGGLTLGGGLGWLIRRAGLSCDNLIGAEVVTASGQVIEVDSASEPELLWGLRGGGGNFGIVTRFDMKLHKVAMGTAAIILFTPDRAREVLRFYRDWAPTLPESAATLAAFTAAPPAPFVPAELHFQPVVGVLAFDSAPPGESNVFEPLLALGPAVPMVAPMPYPAVQSMLDDGAPAGWRNYFKGGFLDSLPDEAIDVLIDAAAAMGPMCQIHLHQLGGAYARIGEDDTAFSNRSAAFAHNVLGVWTDPAEDERHRGWTRATAARLEPFGHGSYVNFLTETGEESARDAYGSKFGRLAALKRRYDPQNLFRLNQNIRP